MIEEVYLDNAATTKPYDAVAKRVETVMLHTYGNPSSLHKMGIDAENILKEANSFFAKEMGATPEEIYYTSGGQKAIIQLLLVQQWPINVQETKSLFQL